MYNNSEVNVMSFLGGLLIFAGLAIFSGTIIYVFVKVRAKVRDFSQLAFGTDDIIKGFKENEAIQDNKPKSLSGMDSLVIPQIKKDFPDFNVEYAKTKAKEALEEYLNSPEGFKIHNVVFTQYLKHHNTITIIMQAAAEMYDESDKKHQKKYQLNYSYMPIDTSENRLANCPNCGAAAPSTGETVCAYCGSRIFITIENSWDFTEVREI